MDYITIIALLLIAYILSGACLEGMDEPKLLRSWGTASNLKEWRDPRGLGRERGMLAMQFEKSQADPAHQGPMMDDARVFSRWNPWGSVNYAEEMHPSV